MHTKDSLSTEQLGTHEDISPSALPCALLITGVLVFCIYDNREWFTHTLITTLSSFVIACLTVFLAYDTRKSRIAMYKQAIKPMLNLQLIRDNSICYLCLENTGVAPALNIEIVVSDPLDMDYRARKGLKELMTDIFANCALLNQTILYLPPNKQIKARLASGFDIDIFSYKVKWTIKFENIRGDPDYSIAYLDPSIKEEKHQYTIESMG